MTTTTVLLAMSAVLIIAAIAIRICQVNSAPHVLDEELEGDASPIFARKS